MSDVRLTATNPEDSSVVPVACNSRGELLITEPVIEQIDNDVTINGNLAVNKVNFKINDLDGAYAIGGTMFLTLTEPGLGQDSFNVNNEGRSRVRRYADGVLQGFAYYGTKETAFDARAGNGTIKWSVDYQGNNSVTSLLIALEPDDPNHYFSSERNGDEISTYKGPVLNVREELEFLRAQVRSLMERLKMTPEGGWEVWDGSD